jgi:hypothetical protein
LRRPLHCRPLTHELETVAASHVLEKVEALEQTEMAEIDLAPTGAAIAQEADIMTEGQPDAYITSFSLRGNALVSLLFVQNSDKLNEAFML